MRAAWLDYHKGQAARLRAAFEPLIARHEAEADRLQTTDERNSA
jgi:hypothetical protein